MLTKQWLLAKDALNGTGGFEDGSFLIQYPRESDEKYKARKESATYVNYMKRSCQRFVDYLSKTPATRQTNNSIIRALVDNCDMQGNHINQFMQSFVLDVRARGTGLILIDMPQTIESSRDQQINERTIPYFTSILPELVTDYSVDKFGRFEFVEFEGSYTIEDKVEPVTYRYDKLSWSIAKGGNIIEGGDHNLGVCPVLSFTESGKFPSLSAYYDIANLSKDLYNKTSELNEILRSQTFSILAYQVPTEADQSIIDEIGAVIGTNNMLLYQGERPDFITPTSIPTEVYRKKISDIKDEVDEISNNVDLGAQQQSGAALALRFQNMNSQLLNYARRLEDFERRLFEVVGLWMNITPDISINYPKDFNMIDKSLEIEVLQNMIAMNAPKSYIIEKMKQIIGADLVGISADKEAEIHAELEEVNHERAE